MSGADEGRPTRPAARLLVLDPADRLLLFRFAPDRGPLAGRVWWATPGGACDPGETFAAAARRELWEETGWRIGDPGPERHARSFPMRLVDGRWVTAEERYFLVRVPGGAPDRSGWTEEERRVVTGWRWWDRTALEAGQDPGAAAELPEGEPLYPPGLAALVAQLLAA